jgi:phosphatidylglycerol lysyltransferase
MRASVGVVVAAFCVGLISLIHRTARRMVPVSTAMPGAVRHLILQSPDAQTSIAWLGDKTFLVTDDSSAFLMYRRSGQSLVSMGDPVGDPHAYEELVWQFREMADRQALRAVFYAVKPRNLPLYLDMGFAILKLGEVARVPLATFSLEGPAHQEHRYAVRRLEKEGISFAVVPAAEFDSICSELAEVSARWLSTKKGQEKGFSLGAFNPDYLRRFDTAVLRKEGRIVAFANLWRGADQEELSADLMRFDADVSKVLMDGLFVHMMLYGRSQGYAWFNLGAAPLSGLSEHPLASTWARIGTYIFRHGENFYHFEGLRAFKQKFDPTWTPQYLACPRGLAIPQVLLDINRLISGSPTALLGPSKPKDALQREAEPIR